MSQQSYLEIPPVPFSDFSFGQDIFFSGLVNRIEAGPDLFYYFSLLEGGVGLLSGFT
jgi:hypothetical protein